MNALKRTALIQEFEEYLKQEYGGFEKEVLFNKIMKTKRRFRADYLVDSGISVMISFRFIVEINGGQWAGGRHNRGGKGYENDLTKLNLAQSYGYRIYQFTYEMLERQEYKDFL